MLPDLDHYFDLAEHLALRSSLLIFLLLALYRLVRREWLNLRVHHDEVIERIIRLQGMQNYLTITARAGSPPTMTTPTPSTERPATGQ